MRLDIDIYLVDKNQSCYIWVYMGCRQKTVCDGFMYHAYFAAQRPLYMDSDAHGRVNHVHIQQMTHDQKKS